MTITRVFDTEPEGLELVGFTENTATSVGVIFKDETGPFCARIYREGETFFMSSFGVSGPPIDEHGWWSSSLSRTISDFSIFLHLIFDGAVFNHTRLKWTELEDAYWDYMETCEPDDFPCFHSQYREEFEGVSQ